MRPPPTRPCSAATACRVFTWCLQALSFLPCRARSAEPLICHVSRPQEEVAPAAPAAEQQPKKKKEGAAQQANHLMDNLGVSLGPIGLTVGSDLQNLSLDEEDGAAQPSGRPKSYASLSTEEWRALYEKDGAVDLWVEEEFNSGSRLVVRSCAAGLAWWRWRWGARGCALLACTQHSIAEQGERMPVAVWRSAAGMSALTPPLPGLPGGALSLTLTPTWPPGPPPRT